MPRRSFGSSPSVGGGGPPSGAAGGDLAGTYPNPTVGLLTITDGKIAAANKDGLANVPSLRTLGTGALQALPGDTDVSGTPAPASRYEAGGDDPITNLGPLVSGQTISDPIQGPIDAAIYVTDSSDVALYNGADLAVWLAPTTGLGGFYAAGTGGIEIQPGGSQIVFLDAAFATRGYISQSVWYLSDNAGYGRVQVVNDGTGVNVYDATGVHRGMLADDGSGLTLSDATTAVRVKISDATSAGIQLQDANQELTAQLSDGSLFVYADDAQGGLTTFGASWATDGVTADVTVQLPTITGGAGAILRTANDGAGDERNMLYIYDMANTPQFVMAWRSPGGGGPIEGHFGATPYGQDAYLAPLDDNLSALTTLVDLITAENESRTRMNAINGYIIARGLEAAA